MVDGVTLWLAHLPNTIAGLAMVAIGIWVVALNPRHVVNRAFAALLVVRGISNLFDPITALTSPLLYVEVLSEVLLPLFVLAFLLVYPRRRGWLGPGAVPWVVLGLVGVTLVALFAVDHDLYGRVRVLEDGAVAVMALGPLLAVAQSQHVFYGLLSLLLVVSALQTPVGPSRQSQLLVALGFAVGPAFWGPGAVFAATVDPFTTAFFWLRVNQWIMVLSAVPVFLAAGLLMRRSVRDGGGHTGGETLTGVGRAFTPVVLGAGVLGVLLYPLEGIHAGPFPLGTLASALAKLAIPILVTYALVKHQLFDIDLKIKWGLKQSTVAAVFIAVFFTVSEVAQQFFGETLGSTYVGIVAAGALVFAIAPLQRLADRVADTAMPHVSDPAAAVAPGERDPAAYRGAVEMALADGVITRAEERALAKLSVRCGLTWEEALEIQEAVERDLGLLDEASPA